MGRSKSRLSCSAVKTEAIPFGASLLQFLAAFQEKFCVITFLCSHACLGFDSAGQRTGNDAIAESMVRNGDGIVGVIGAESETGLCKKKVEGGNTEKGFYGSIQVTVCRHRRNENPQNVTVMILDSLKPAW